MCDRIYVMSEGRIVAELPREKATQEAIMASILKANEAKANEVKENEAPDAGLPARKTA
jgi:putative multiple sugar transport system ATP-binding protein